ncbi:PREDICTED: protein SENSITIVITY TO RED LIGHT REDUCED 1 [Tarenaya hassleriana]|uniref:protein SENSITIVITY TO RED LIGHT REDUCED 1 n=1 Tax=Tarenaya hassleriana TaxID=28532 RepID=UPI00053C1A36|nr:PREDICTED: protein SENSITIVITY TO RED LIGHT REDUCED 1 [Tarenaya hassleriana]XP_010530619.1 PREDICTED: protein SENSITIVITY TO RED LIGHT REDUCED 1 [Tarenaya hassleriana]XP_010530628.1 PREDICTED: protein SENSITIVITY TO RED LIGHT REDUCED 1 [Tarenaya hassleriana]
MGSVNNSSEDGEWKVVLNRRGRQGRRFPKYKAQEEEEQQQPWTPNELEVDSLRQSRLIQKMEISMKKLENSQFYAEFVGKIQAPEVLDHFRRVLGTESQLNMVIYGIGSIESYEPPRFQLSIAILLKKKFDWIGDIEVFDPVLSATESNVVTSLGCSVLSVNEQGRREAIKPTLFFMPHCEAELYSNLLQANWRTDSLSRIALFGNSFQTYEQHVVENKNSLNPRVISSTRRIIAVRSFTHEFAIETVSDDYFPAFHDSSWHFFCHDHPDSELPLVDS